MNQIFQWVKNITYYLIFIGMISNLMPSGKYERYIRLFSGAVFLLLIVSPLTGGLKLEGKLAYAYEMLLFRQDTGQFQNRLYEMEQEQTRQIINQYEKAAAQDVMAMAEGEGFLCEEANVQIEAGADQERYGQVTGIWLVLRRKETKREEGEQNQAAGEELDEEPAKTKEIRIQVEIGDDRERSRAVSSDEVSNQMTAGEREVLDEFQRKVAGVYGLEETDIRITWKDD